MSGVNLPVNFHAPSRVAIPTPSIQPRRLLVAANALSLSRGLAAVAIFAMYAFGVRGLALVMTATAMWATDALDGWVARKGHKLGAQRRTDGAALDPLMDDVAFIIGFLVLLDAHIVPLWFVAALLTSRVLFALIRFTGLIHADRFARSDPITKFNGAVLAIGQVLLLARLAFPYAPLRNEELIHIAVGVMTATSAYSVVHFGLRKHGRLLTRLLTP